MAEKQLTMVQYDEITSLLPYVGLRVVYASSCNWFHCVGTAIVIFSFWSTRLMYTCVFYCKIYASKTVSCICL